MNQGTPESGCPECGALVGHRAIVVVDDDDAMGPMPASLATRACSLGGDVVPRAEYSRLAKDLEDERTGWDTVYARMNKALGVYQDHLARQAKCIAETEEERDAYLANLTSVQSRCNELLEENRALKAEVKERAEEVLAHCGAV